MVTFWWMIPGRLMKCELSFINFLIRNYFQIVDVGENYSSAKHADVELVQLNKRQFLMPGFIDTHIHAPQFAQNGLGLDMELLDWLNTYTFPLESKFADKDFAAKIYKNVVVSGYRLS